MKKKENPIKIHFKNYLTKIKFWPFIQRYREDIKYFSSASYKERKAK